MQRVSNGEVARRRETRRRLVKAHQRSTRKRRSGDMLGRKFKLRAKRWTPGKRYTMIKSGLTMECHPSDLWKRGELTRGHLWFFKSNDPEALRCSTVDGLSKYESVFVVDDGVKKAYVVPIHKHLEQITKGYDVARADDILDDGTPYFPDKRLKRVRDDTHHRAGHIKRKRR